MTTDTMREIDSLIRPYLLEKDDETARHLLGELVSQQADPIIKGVIARQTRTDAGRRATAARRRDAEIQEEIVSQLVARLEALRGNDSTREADPIADLRGYVAGLALENCQSWLRRLFPRRARLRNRLRYLLGHDGRFLLRPVMPAGWLCGLADRDARSMRQGVERNPTAGVSAPLETSAPAEAGGPPSVSADPTPGELALLARDLLTRAGRPLDLEFLVDAVARHCGLDEPPERAAGGEERDRAAAGRPEARAVPEIPRDDRDWLRRIWDAILTLPPLQRSVLLLGLRNARGQGLIGLFPVTGVAGIRRIAIALGMLPERFAEAWKDLPLEDDEIAARLRLSPQQVIELRGAAMERLARRKRKD